MQDDAIAIRELVAAWMNATRSGDIETVLSLMTDDVVFLLPGRRSMIGKDAFAAASRSQTGEAAPTVDGRSEIEEIQVLGDWAFARSNLTVTVTPRDGAPVRRAGYTLSLFRKEHGRWLLARDANMLSPIEETASCQEEP
jgi:uncharacterized protein (TIGR02246 family)